MASAVDYLLKLNTRFHVQERPIRLVKFYHLYLKRHIICVTKYKYSIFSSFSLWQIIFPCLLLDISCNWNQSIFLSCHVPSISWKWLFCSFKFNLINWGALKFTNYQYFWVLLLEIWLPGRICYISLFTLFNPLSQNNKNHQIIIPFVGKTWVFASVHIYLKYFKTQNMKLLFIIICVKSDFVGTLSLILAAAICCGVLSWGFAVAFCCGNLPQLFAGGFLFVWKQTFFLYE